MKRPNPHEVALKWNNSHSVGTPVTRYKLINPLREPQETKTRSPAWVMGGHSAMVMVKGVSGGVLVESVVARSVRDGTENHLADQVSQNTASVSVERDKKDLGEPGGV